MPTIDVHECRKQRGRSDLICGETSGEQDWRQQRAAADAVDTAYRPHGEREDVDQSSALTRWLTVGSGRSSVRRASAKVLAAAERPQR